MLNSRNLLCGLFKFLIFFNPYASTPIFFSMILVFSFFLLVMSSRRSEEEIKDFAAARKVQIPEG